MPINEQPVYDWVDVRVLNKTTGSPTLILADGITVRIQRGNDAGIAGIASVEVGSAIISLMDPATPIYDPTTTSLLQPNMPIEVYEKGDPTVPIFTGVILDLATRYEFHPIFRDTLVTYVDIYAVDAVSEWGGKVYPDSSYPISLVTSEPATSETWANRILRIKESLSTIYDNNSPINPPSAVGDVLLYEKRSGW
jgi:hypothetical protein